MITPQKRKQAAALVKEGFSVSLERTAMTEKAPDNPTPYEVEGYAKPVTPGGVEVYSYDRFSVTYHGGAHTHLDALDHTFTAPGGKVYNGHQYDPATVKQGHPRNTIVNVKGGIFTRGILIDIPRLKGVPYLEPGTPIYIEDLEAWEKKAGVKVSAGMLFSSERGDGLYGRSSARRVEGLGPDSMPP